MILIPTTDFVIQESTNKEVSKNFSGFSDIQNNMKLSYENIVRYANFLKTPLELEMFNIDSPYDCLFEDVFLSEDGEIYSNGNQIMQFESGCFFDRTQFFNDELEHTSIQSLTNYGLKLNKNALIRIFGKAII